MSLGGDTFEWRSVNRAPQGASPALKRRVQAHFKHLLVEQMSPDYIQAVPTPDLTDDELAAVTAAVRRAIEDDRFPHAPRLDPLRSALAKLEPATPAPKPTPLPKVAPPAKADKRARR
jgi:hypothetical protein